MHETSNTPSRTHHTVKYSLHLALVPLLSSTGTHTPPPSPLLLHSSTPRYPPTPTPPHPTHTPPPSAHSQTQIPDGMPRLLTTHARDSKVTESHLPRVATSPCYLTLTSCGRKRRHARQHRSFTRWPGAVVTLTASE